MRLTSFLCLGGLELANDARSYAYARNLGLPNLATLGDCSCAAYDDGDYVSPSTDPAPWYDSTRPESADFYGAVLPNMTFNPNLGRTMTPTGLSGGFLGRFRPGSPVLNVAGHLWATTAQGMHYGEQWVKEVLRGDQCDDGIGQEALILPACPEETGYDDSSYAFRSLVNVGLIERPEFAPVGSFGEWYLQTVTFQLAAGVAYMFHPATEVIADTLSYGGSLDGSFTTSEWMGDGTMDISIENTGIQEGTDITVTGQISIDGSCPVVGAGTSVPPSFTYVIPSLLPGDRIVIDGRRRDVRYYDASCREPSSGFPYITFTGPFKYPDVGGCSTMCITVENDDAELLVTVDGFLREL